MTALQPPSLATWLLRQFVSGAHYEPLIGDMLEEYRAGRSPLWYWRQVLVAIVQSCYKDTRAHRLLALRAVITTAVVFNLLWFFVVDAVLMQIQSVVFWMFAGGHGLPGWPPYFDGLHRVLLTFAGAVTGWTVARLHPQHQGTMVLLSAMALPFLQLPLFVADSLHYETSLSDVIAMATFTLLGMTGILIGGLINAEEKEFLA